MSKHDLHLASSSSRRREILASLGLPFTWAATNVDETPLTGESAEAMVLRLAAAKARAAGQPRATAVLGADTAVVLRSKILGKPRSPDEAKAMLRSLSGRSHRVLTGVMLIFQGEESSALSSTTVRFREIAPEEFTAYCRSGEYEGKAGAYAIQGLGGMFVETLKGSYSGVVGLPVCETAGLLRAAGLDPFRLSTLVGWAP